MKKLVLSIALAIGSMATFAQSEKFVATMTEQAAAIQANYENSYMPMANKMERIAAAEAKEWTPQYWMAYCLINETFKLKEAAEKDLLLEKAEGFIKKAESISPKNDEIEVLKAQYAIAKLSVDPMSRWQKYGADFQEALKKAEEINPENPRVPYVMGTNIFYTPEGFGGGQAKAKPYFEKAIAKFSTFKSATAYAPNWGKEASNYFLSQIK
ncbi:protein phosphatase CheZ [Lacihabitans soyangensis]|uniref:Tetratricopeptide repeat protein n=1 Tax=Lacihabitans soyangensis TaxID=869394 RepID=A0AAE3KXW3_9BACT|nr:protein phosphatase CheZ [Lacihabitans soyangensis]MCP9765955.1 hypothetical protein [Lacihabitans soyangensis]